jgi:hypothetical protein
LHVLSDLLLSDVLPGTVAISGIHRGVKRCRNCVEYTVRVAIPNSGWSILEPYSERTARWVWWRRGHAAWEGPSPAR